MQFLLFALRSKAPHVLHLPSPASSSLSDVPSGLNASVKTPTEGGAPPRFYIGVALTFGFTFMFAVEQIGGYLSMRGKLAELSHQCHFCTCELCTSASRSPDHV